MYDFDLGEIKGMEKEICLVGNREIIFGNRFYAGINLSKFRQYFTVIFITTYIPGKLIVHIIFVVCI
jgi:hypothetical protein